MGFPAKVLPYVDVVKRLSSKNLKTRLSGVKQLIYHRKQLLDHLSVLFQDEHEEVRLLALQIFRDLASKHAENTELQQQLLTIMHGDSDDRVANMAARLLARMGNEQALPRILSQLQMEEQEWPDHDHIWVLAQDATCLGSTMGTALLALLSDPEEPLTGVIFTTLRMISFEEQELPQVRAALLALLRRDTNSVDSPLASVVKQLTPSDAFLQVLKHFYDKAYFEPIWETFIEQRWTFSCLPYMLLSLDKDELTARMIAFLSNPLMTSEQLEWAFPVVRRCDLSNIALLDVLLERLKGTQPTDTSRTWLLLLVRDVAYVVNLKQSWHRKPLLELLLEYLPQAFQQKEEGQFGNICALLGDLQDPRAVEPLLEILPEALKLPVHSIDAHEALYVIRALGLIGDERIRKPLQQVIKDLKGRDDLAGKKQQKVAKLAIKFLPK